MEALGRNHAFETAIADLIDNSVDASATNTLIRFVRRGDRLIGLLVVDDGRGMNDKQLNVAMTIGGRRKYEPTDLGRFGLGLKAASFSQAKSLTVVSRAARSKACGRRWHIGRAKTFLCDVVEGDFAEALLVRDWGLPTSRTGTVVRWDEVTGFPSVSDPGIIDRFLTSTIAKLRLHLGLVYHRLIERGLTHIYVDVEDVESGEGGLRYEVVALDPFNYLRSGRLGYPATIKANTGHDLTLNCHLWPGRSVVPEFKLPGGPLERQGFYFYLRDRLIQAGGWNGVQHPEKWLSLARVAVDIDGDIEGVFALKPEKTGIEPGPEFPELVRSARNGKGVTFASYLKDAEATYREARKRRSQRRAVFPPGKGFDPALKKTIGNELRYIEGETPIEMRWRSFASRDFFEVDRDERIIWLNERYRADLLGSRRASLNDMPVLKALVYLLVEDVFHGQYLGSRDKDNLDLWQSVLTTAVLAGSE
jgi:Histidine kinase-, DNA gyrase B-, and HSP90-like ATPase